MFDAYSTTAKNLVDAGANPEFADFLIKDNSLINGTSYGICGLSSLMEEIESFRPDAKGNELVNPLTNGSDYLIRRGRYDEVEQRMQMVMKHLPGLDMTAVCNGGSTNSPWLDMYEIGKAETGEAMMLHPNFDPEKLKGTARGFYVYLRNSNPEKYKALPAIKVETKDLLNAAASFGKNKDLSQQITEYLIRRRDLSLKNILNEFYGANRTNVFHQIKASPRYHEITQESKKNFVHRNSWSGDYNAPIVAEFLAEGVPLGGNKLGKSDFDQAIESGNLKMAEAMLPYVEFSKGNKAELRSWLMGARMNNVGFEEKKQIKNRYLQQFTTKYTQKLFDQLPQFAKDMAPGKTELETINLYVPALYVAAHVKSAEKIKNIQQPIYKADGKYYNLDAVKAEGKVYEAAFRNFTYYHSGDEYDLSMKMAAKIVEEARKGNAEVCSPLSKKLRDQYINSANGEFYTGNKEDIELAKADNALFNSSAENALKRSHARGQQTAKTKDDYSM